MEYGKELLAYCGLYCGDCAGYSGEIAKSAIYLQNLFSKYHFEITAKHYFSKDLKEYNKFTNMLQFITTLKCEKVCRKKTDNDTKCKIRKCCIDKGFFACYECNNYKRCENLKAQEKAHGDSCLKNFQAIKEMGIDNWVKTGKRYWFGSKFDL
jgi:hypothetical protein